MNGRLPSPEAFSLHVGSIFLLSLTEDSTLAALCLCEVEQWHRGEFLGCSLRFSGPDLGRPAHDTYQLEHAHLGVFSLFLGPVVDGTAKAGEVCYQAVITRLKPHRSNLPKEIEGHE
jgi:hypothetical protein